MFLMIGIGILWLMSILINHNFWFVIFITVSSVCSLLRLKAVLFKYKTIVRWEVIAIIVPFLFALVFKRIILTKLVLTLIVRGLYLLLVRHDFKTYIYPHKRIVVDGEE